jgi:hypothetical protein
MISRLIPASAAMTAMSTDIEAFKIRTLSAPKRRFLESQTKRLR